MMKDNYTQERILVEVSSLMLLLFTLFVKFFPIKEEGNRLMIRFLFGISLSFTLSIFIGMVIIFWIDPQKLKLIEKLRWTEFTLFLYGMTLLLLYETYILKLLHIITIIYIILIIFLLPIIFIAIGILVEKLK